MKSLRDTSKYHVMVRDGKVVPDPTPRYVSEGPIVKWSSRGSGVVYTPHKTSRHEYERLQLNRVAHDLRAGAMGQDSLRPCIAGLIRHGSEPVTITRRMARARQRAGVWVSI